MRKTKARKNKKYEITVMWKNEDKERGDGIECEDTIEAPDVSAARKYIESLPEKIGLGGGQWKWNRGKTVYRQKGGTEADHYITYEKVC